MNVFGKEIIHLSTVDSTNNFAATLISDQLCQSGTAIMADTQTLGRGQRGNNWQSEPGKNLLVSYIFKPDKLSVIRMPELTWATSLSLVKTLGKFNITGHVKWPNDVLVNGKKIAGVLIENQLSGEFISSAIIGIGLNINQSEFGDFNATSMFLELNAELSKERVFYDLSSSMNDIFQEIGSSKSTKLRSDYESALFQKNSSCFYKDEHGQFEGEIVGVNESGHLLVKVAEEIREYGLKEISYCSK